MAKTKGKSQSKGKPKARSRAGLLPGQYRKRATVYVERLRGPEEAAHYGEDDLYTTDPYIVITTRTDGQWSCTVELRGEKHHLPGKVIDRINSQRAAIIKEQRSDRSRERQERIKAQGIAEADQAAAEEEDDGVVPDWINDV